MAVRLPVDPSENLDQIIGRLKKYNSQDVVLVLPPETRVSITNTRGATGVVAHRNHCIRIASAWSNLPAIAAACPQFGHACSARE